MAAAKKNDLIILVEKIGQFISFPPEKEIDYLNAAIFYHIMQVYNRIS